MSKRSDLTKAALQALPGMEQLNQMMMQQNTCPVSSTNASTYENIPTSRQGFKILQELGQGSFSVIYQAIDYARNKEVAIKMEKADKARRILVAEY
jgi:serine/threonine protein kinase